MTHAEHAVTSQPASQPRRYTGLPDSNGARWLARLLLAALAFVASGCPGGAPGEGCVRPSGCDDAPCCSASTRCQEHVCQGATYTCRAATAGVFNWSLGATGSSCAPSADLGTVDTTPGRRDGPRPPKPDTGGLFDLTVDTEPAKQGRKCSQSGVELEVDRDLVQCTTVTLTARSSSGYAWVMGGIDAPGGSAEWRGGASVSGSYQWVFSGVKVPCRPGPYELKLRRDAVNDDPSKGSVVGACTP